MNNAYVVEAYGRDENGSNTVGNCSIIFVFIFFLGIEIGIGNPDTKTESNIIEYRYGANTNRNEYGNE